MADAANGPDRLRDRGGQLAGGSAGGLSGLAIAGRRIARLNVIGAGFFVWWWLAYPTGRLKDNLTRVVGRQLGWGVMMIPALLFYDNPPSYFYVGHTVSWLDSWNWWSTLAVIAVAEPVLKFMLVRRLFERAREPDARSDRCSLPS